MIIIAYGRFFLRGPTGGLRLLPCRRIGAPFGRRIVSNSAATIAYDDNPNSIAPDHGFDRDAITTCTTDTIRTRSPRASHSRHAAANGLMPSAAQNSASLRLCCASRASRWCSAQTGRTHFDSGFLPSPLALPYAALERRRWAGSLGSIPQCKQGSCLTKAK